MVFHLFQNLVRWLEIFHVTLQDKISSNKIKESGMYSILSPSHIMRCHRLEKRCKVALALIFCVLAIISTELFADSMVSVL